MTRSSWRLDCSEFPKKTVKEIGRSSALTRFSVPDERLKARSWVMSIDRPPYLKATTLATTRIPPTSEAVKAVSENSRTRRIVGLTWR